MNQALVDSERYLLADWPAPANVRAMITTRKGGVSAEPYDSFNLSFRSGDREEDVMANRQQLIADWNWPSSPCWLNQVHGTTVVDAATAVKEPEADAAIARAVNQPAIVMVADCVPVLFCNDAGDCVAAAHAGWKGLATGVLKTTVAEMTNAPATLMAWIGPAISQPFFEVGPEVRDLFLTHHKEAKQGFIAGNGDRWLANLHFLARQQLKNAGVHRIYGADTCVFTQKERFFSYRRDGKKSGRMAAAIWLLSR